MKQTTNNRAHRLNARRRFMATAGAATLSSLPTFCVTRPSHAAARWPQEWVNGSFVYHADFQVPDTGRIVKETHTLKSDVPRTLGLTASDEPVHVYLFHDRKTYEGYLQRYFPSVPFRRALFIKQHGHGMVFAFHSGEFMVDLRHETTHAVLHTLLPMVPLWLDEGLAEYFEVERAARASRNPHLSKVQKNLRWRPVPGLDDLERLHRIEQMKGACYRDAWAWAHFLLHGPPLITEEFRGYLGDIQAQTPPGMLDARLRTRSQSLAADFRRHFKERA